MNLSNRAFHAVTFSSSSFSCIYTVSTIAFLIVVSGYAYAETAIKEESEAAPIMIEIDTTDFKVNNDEKCKTYKPDYSKYGSIIHLTLNFPLDGESNGKKTPLYFANSSGKDPVSGESRRISYTVNLDSFFTTGMGTLETGIGKPGTRITFAGDENDPFEPIPGLLVWDGAIDIDPECGMLVRASHPEPKPWWKFW
jgi:hypothetical protein